MMPSQKTLLKVYPLLCFVSTKDDTMHHFHKLTNLFDELGLPMNKDKCCPPSRILTCLGITMDLDNNSLSTETTKQEDIYSESLQVRPKSTISRRQFQSLLGKLIYLHKCIKPARIFINIILAVFRDKSHSKKINFSWTLTGS